MSYNEVDERTLGDSREVALVALQQLWSDWEHNPEQPVTLPLKAIKQVPEVFQVRRGLHRPHVDVLLDRLRAGVVLDPLHVWRCGGTVILINGHHRREAYRQYQIDQQRILDVPVEFFPGDAMAAFKKAVEENTKSYLPMDRRERFDLAWELVKLGIAAYSKAEIRRKTNVGASTIAEMRKYWREHSDELRDAKSWSSVLYHVGKGRNWTFLEEDERNEKISAHVYNLVEKIRKAVGRHLRRNPEVAAMVLDQYFEEEAREVLRCWASENGLSRADLLRVGEDEFDPDEEDPF